MIREPSPTLPLTPTAADAPDAEPCRSTAGFLRVMDAKIPWNLLGRLVANRRATLRRWTASYPERVLLRLVLLRHWFGLAIDQLHDALVESDSMREFAGMDGAVSPDALAHAVSEFESMLERDEVMATINEICDRVLEQHRQKVVPGVYTAPSLQPAPPPSAKLESLSRYIASISPPYGIPEIMGFNAIYQGIYSDLTIEERHLAEAYVEMLMEGVDRPDNAARIFGVV